MNDSGNDDKGRLAIIAGSGFLPAYLAEAARQAGENPVIVVLKDEVLRDWSDYDHALLGVGDFKGFEALFDRYDVRRIVMSGSVARRPEWREIRPTWQSLVRMPGVVKTLLSGGDDTVLKMVIGLLEVKGRKVIGAHDIAPDLLATTGTLGSHAPSEDDMRDIKQAARAADALGMLDVGQGAVSVGGRIVALEGVEGTDQMIERVAGLRAAGRISHRRRGVLVKLCKPQQDLRADLPSIGVSTILNAKAAGLGGVAVEAGRALILERKATIDAANEAGLFLFGIDRGLTAGGIQ
ncbi:MULTISPECIES: LpxI family protein [unclassified Rhizobium]|uniref:LpxI family protein n=1 Tax=unclassified Rhizobium TaxID=2613769 RepID=UPI001ADAE095|nr:MULTISPECIES: LpxI family protein [unclassified Rhizobium]MBO9098307.1 LpxI family protein [Rhizobium sp. L58/93]MBO9168573.1 LpxI family protein [Rhizobium sp. L245/93]MBO9184502.1 LpxI family protein [Rhizobium sp. E27B/91]MBO9132889.1 LpxI family protein [Rhizobium sp. B209b/85]QXZ84709.1 LpxI family protein [Rhizobium sp. K1/93]